MTNPTSLPLALPVSVFWHDDCYQIQGANGLYIARVYRKESADAIVAALNSHAKLLAAVGELRTVLEFYADNNNYCRVMINDRYDDNDERTFAPVLQDDGTRATQALLNTRTEGEK